MLTPQQVQEIRFERARHGYDMQAVDQALGALVQDYLTLYKDNSVLKSKMRVLVEKLEEYRNQEKSLQATMLAAQRTCEQMRRETEEKCAEMLKNAEANAATQRAEEEIAAQQARLDEAKAASASFLDEMEKRLRRQIELLNELRADRKLPATKSEAPGEKAAFDFDSDPSEPVAAQGTDDSPTRKLDALHGSFSPEKQRIFDELAFGKNRDTTE